MRECFLLTILSVSLLSSNALASVEPADHVLDEKEKAIYMIGSEYSRLTGAISMPNESNVIYKINLEDNSKVIFYESTGINLDRLKLSSDGSFIGVLKDHRSSKRESELLIINVKERRVVDSLLDNIQMYSWSPEGGQAIYVTGVRYEGAGMRPDGVWNYDISKKSKKKISDGALNIQWAANEKIYLINHSTIVEKCKNYQKPKKVKYETVIYDYKQGKAVQGFINGINFSLDGKFSILLDVQYDELELAEMGLKRQHVDIYDIRRDRARRIVSIFADPDKILWTSYVWVANNRLIAIQGVRGKKLYEILFCDIESDTILKKVDGIMVGTNRARDKVVIYNGMSFDILNVP